MARKRLNKGHFIVLMKIFLNKGNKKTSEILAEHEMKEFNELVENGYIGIANKSYSYVTAEGRPFERVIENCLETMESMYEVGYVSGRVV